MTLQIAHTTPHFEVEASEGRGGKPRPSNCGVSLDLFQVMARTTACSPTVLSGLFAWARLDSASAYNASEIPLITNAI